METHEEFYVVTSIGETRLYMKQESFSIESAATIFVHNQPNNNYNDYDYDDATFWFNLAVKGGIVFG